MRTRRTIVAMLSAAALTVAACGGGDDSGAAGGDTTAATTPSSGTDATSAPDTAAPDTSSGSSSTPDTGTPDTGAPDTTEPLDLPECPLDALDSADQPVEVTVWHTEIAQPLETLETLVAEYNSSQDRVQVTLESQGSSYGELKRKFQAALPSGDLPAILVFDDTATKDMADSGVILPAAACFQASGYDTGQLAPVAVNYYSIDGVLWPAVAHLGGILLYYNRNHFVAAGLDPDDPPQTLEELRAAAEAIKAAGVSDAPLVHELSSWKTEFWLTGAHSALVDNENGRGSGETLHANLSESPEALELFTWFKDMTDDGLMEPVPSTDGQIDQYLALATQSASMVVETSSAATSVQAFLQGELDPDVLDNPPDPSGLDLSAGPFPGMVPGNATQMGGEAWYMTNTVDPEVQAAAWDFLSFMNEPQPQIDFLVGGSLIPWLTSVRDDPQIIEFYEASLAGHWMQIAAEQIDAIDPEFPGPLIGPYDPDVRDAIESAQDALLLGDATPQEALDQAQEEIDAILEDYASFD